MFTQIRQFCLKSGLLRVVPCFLCPQGWYHGANNVPVPVHSSKTTSKNVIRFLDHSFVSKFTLHIEMGIKNFPD